MGKIDTIVFDLGGVLIDWNPDYVYNNIFPDEKERKWFYENICTPDWNEEQDAGRSLQAATELLVNKFPEHEKNIRIYYDRWQEMLGGPIHETVEVLHHLKHHTDIRLYALTNWSAETFPHALERFEFFKIFEGIVVSGEEKMKKPSAAFYSIIINRYRLDPSKTIFIDDSLRNIKGAEAIGITGIHFHNPSQLKEELQRIGIEIF